MALINRGTKWSRKDRAGVESMLNFDGVGNGNVIQVIKDERLTVYNDAGFSVSLFLDAASATNSYITGQRTTAGSGTNTWHLFIDGSGRLSFNCQGVLSDALYNGFISQHQNKKTHITCVYRVIDGSNADALLYINGKLSAENASKTILGDFTALGDLFIGTSHENKISTYGGGISHFAFFNKDLLQEEISYIHTTGGIIPESAHQNCVLHLPLAQRQYFNASSDFIANHTQFSLDDLVALDIAEQYNYVKYKYIDIQGARLADFTGAPTNGATYLEGNDGDGDYVEFNAGTPMVNSQILSPIHLQQDSGSDPVVIAGDRLVLKIRQKFTVAGSRYAHNISFIGATTFYETTEGVVVFSTDATNAVAAGGHSRSLILMYNLSIGAPDTSSVRIYDIEFYLQRKVPLAAKHAELVTFTDAEVGADSRQNQTEIKDFYNKRPVNYGVFKQIYSVENGALTVTGVNLTSLDKLMIYEGSFDRAGTTLSSATTICGLRNTGAVLAFTLTMSAGTGTNLIMEFRIGASVIVQAVQELEIENTNWRAVCYHNYTSNDYVFAIKINGKIYSFSGNEVPAAPDFSANTWRIGKLQSGTSGHINYIREFVVASPASLTEAQAEDLINYDYSSITPLIELVCSDVEGSIIDRQGNTVSITANDNATARALGGGAWLEADSHMPELSQAMTVPETIIMKVPRFVGDKHAAGPVSFVMTFKFTPTTITSGTRYFLYFWNLTDTAFLTTGTRISGKCELEVEIYPESAIAGGHPQDFATVIISNLQNGLGDSVNPVYMNGRIQGYSNSTTPGDATGIELRASGPVGGMEVVRFGSWNRLITQEEAAEISNNTLFRNPTLAQQVGLTSYYNMNEASFYDDGDLVRLKNWAPLVDPEYFVPLPSDAAWFYSATITETAEQITHDGTAGNIRSCNVTPINMVNDSDPTVELQFNVVSNTGSFWVFVGDSGTPFDEKVEITAASGVQKLWLKANGLGKVTFHNYGDASNNDYSAVWTIDQISILPLNIDANVTGLTGADSAAQLLDVPGRLTDVNDLR